MGIFSSLRSRLTGGTLTVDNSVVETFDVKQYLGSWYEIARYDHFFERGMEQTKANYIMEDNGKITVLNTGISPKIQEPLCLMRLKGEGMIQRN